MMRGRLCSVREHEGGGGGWRLAAGASRVTRGVGCGAALGSGVAFVGLDRATLGGRVQYYSRQAEAEEEGMWDGLA